MAMYEDEFEGVERESTESDELIDSPFDPSRIRITQKPLTMDLLLGRMEDDAIDLQPEFQRRKVWRIREQSQLIESMLIRVPLPAFYFDATDDDRWLVIDGLQRLTTIHEFVQEQSLVLEGLEFLHEYERSHFDELPPKLRRRIRETQITAFLVDEGTPPQVKFNIFKRINTGGSPLSTQEIRHAVCRGADGIAHASGLLRRLADTDAFRRATDGGVRDHRRQDEECVLRALAFMRSDYADYNSFDLDEFLRARMVDLNDVSEGEAEELSERFTAACEAAADIFGRQAFRKSIVDPSGRRSQVNRALFETWVSILARLDQEDLDVLVDEREAVTDGFVELLDNPLFDSAISVGTGAPSKVRRRFGGIEALVQQVVGA